MYIQFIYNDVILNIKPRKVNFIPIVIKNMDGKEMSLIDLYLLFVLFYYLSFLYLSYHIINNHNILIKIEELSIFLILFNYQFNFLE